MFAALFLSLLLFYTATQGLALVSSDIDSKNAPVNSSVSTTNTSSTSLSIFVYRSPPTNLRRRQDNMRPVNYCNSPTATFVHSHCLHRPSSIGSMMSYIAFCREASPEDSDKHPTNTFTVHRLPRPTAEIGRCGQDEVCMNGEVPGGWGTSMAWCIQRNGFSKLTGTIDEVLWKGREGMEMGGMMANAVMSDPQGSTPLNVPEMGLTFAVEEAGASANSSLSPGSLKTQTCKDCFELITPDLPPETSLVTTDVKVAGTAAVLGILWLAVLSG